MEKYLDEMEQVVLPGTLERPQGGSLSKLEETYLWIVCVYGIKRKFGDFDKMVLEEEMLLYSYLKD